MLVYIRKTPNLVSGMGAFSDALKLSPRISRVCLGSITPSSHSLALKKNKKNHQALLLKKILDINRGDINNKYMYHGSCAFLLTKNSVIQSHVFVAKNVDTLD